MSREDGSEAASIHVAEYESLRREIETRATLSSSLIALELSALGFGLAAAQTRIDLYAGLAFLSIIFWLFWLDHTEQIWKMATYIAIRLRPTLADRAPGALGWESFLRELDRKLVRSKNSAAAYVTLLFASVPPLLAIAFAVRAALERDHVDTTMIARFVGAFAILAFWAFALDQLRRFTHSRNQMDGWISDPDSYPRD